MDTYFQLHPDGLSEIFADCEKIPSDTRLAKLSLKLVHNHSTMELSPIYVSFPRAPILDWHCFATAPHMSVPSVIDLPNRLTTTSGRAAIYQALCQLSLPPGGIVLLPTYHCPTMVAPVLLAGLNVAFYLLDEDGLPNLTALEPSMIAQAGAIIVPHFFGIPKSLLHVRIWCDQHEIALIEDCAHCLFGSTGTQAIGTTGDFATASLSKFLPVPEAGLLASNRRTISPPSLTKRPLGAQLRGVIDVLELSVMHGGLKPFNLPMTLMFNLKKWHRDGTTTLHSEPRTQEEMMQQCDMGRIAASPLWISEFLARTLPHDCIADRRRNNFSIYLAELNGLSGARPLYDELPPSAVPYVFPLLVEDADRIYAETRKRQLPVFRWDRIWPGTPSVQGDIGARWSKHLLQLLCHQGLSSQDCFQISREFRSLL